MCSAVMAGVSVPVGVSVWACSELVSLRDANTRARLDAAVGSGGRVAAAKAEAGSPGGGDCVGESSRARFPDVSV